MVHLSETAGIWRHVAQDDVSLAVWEQLQQLGLRGGISDVMTGQEVGTVQRWYVQQINANNCAARHLWI